MFRHVVVLTFVEGTTVDELEAIAARLRELPDRIPELAAYAVGVDVGLAEGNGDLAVVADFEDVAGYLAYMHHPDHVRVLEEMIRPRLAARAAVQHDRG